MQVLGKAKMIEISGLFADGAVQILEQLQSASNDNDQNEVKQLAHKLKGSAGSLGLRSLFELCLNIEKSTQPVELYTEQKEQLSVLVKQSQQALDEILN
jgi:two-component system sensor histidine kinase TorS